MKYLSLYEGSYTFSADEFDLAKFQSTLNYPESSPLPAAINDFLGARLLPSLGDSPVSYQYCLSPIRSRDARNRSVQISPTAFLSGPIIYRFLRNSEQVIILLVTIRREQYYNDWQDYIAYSFYNALLHQAVDRIRNQILGVMRLANLQLTQRYAPGYCGWPITDQKTLLSLVRPHKIGVALSESYTLQPTHTITGLFGIRIREGIREKMPCYTCTSVSCKVHFEFQQELLLMEELVHGRR